jgi:DNA ligase (NAD+)
MRIFDVIETDSLPDSHINTLALALSCGLPVIESHAVPGENVLQTIAALNRQRAELPFPTDGLVIKLNDRTNYERMGSTDRFPQGALARKYKEVPVETRLLNVEWTCGETGKLTPVGVFEPIELDGATLQRASLHNLDHLRALDLMLGDRIQVIRAGGAIPEIIGIVPRKRTGEEQPIPDPEWSN